MIETRNSKIFIQKKQRTPNKAIFYISEFPSNMNYHSLKYSIFKGVLLLTIEMKAGIMVWIQTIIYTFSYVKTETISIGIIYTVNLWIFFKNRLNIQIVVWTMILQYCQLYKFAAWNCDFTDLRVAFCVIRKSDALNILAVVQNGLSIYSLLKKLGPKNWISFQQ